MKGASQDKERLEEIITFLSRIGGSTAARAVTDLRDLSKRLLSGEDGRLACRNWIEDGDHGGHHCNKPAKYIVWGKLYPKEFLGPRCEDCALDQVGYNALLPGGGYAIYHLPAASPLLSEGVGEDGEETAREYRVNAHDGIYGPFADAQTALRELGEHQADYDDNGWPRPPELESRAVGPWEEGRFGSGKQPDPTQLPGQEGDGKLKCKRCGEVPHSTLTDQCPHCGAPEYGQVEPDQEGEDDWPEEPVQRIAAVIEAAKRHEADVAPRCESGLPNDIARAQGEAQAFAYLRELLEQKLPAPDGEEQ